MDLPLSRPVSKTAGPPSHHHRIVPGEPPLARFDTRDIDDDGVVEVEVEQVVGGVGEEGMALNA